MPSLATRFHAQVSPLKYCFPPRELTPKGVTDTIRIHVRYIKTHVSWALPCVGITLDTYQDTSPQDTCILDSSSRYTQIYSYRSDPIRKPNTTVQTTRIAKLHEVGCDTRVCSNLHDDLRPWISVVPGGTGSVPLARSLAKSMVAESIPKHP